MACLRETWIRSFSVTDPTTHEKGFTVYKITYRAFLINKPEEVQEVVVWKRYNDFKKLHKALSIHHLNLRRPEKFPEFAKARIFGRFDESVLEERRKSALELLEFTCKVPPLAKSKAFRDFFEGGERLTLTSSPGHHPSSNILQPTPIHKQPKETEQTLPSTDNSLPSKETLEESQESTNETLVEGEGGTPTLGGVWLHRQEEEEIDDDPEDSMDSPHGYIYNESDDDRTTFSEDSIPNTPLGPLQDVSMFDPLANDEIGSSQSSLPHSNSWLFHAMDLCADLKTDSPEASQVSSLSNSTADLSSDSGITMNFPHVKELPSVETDVDRASQPAVLHIQQDSVDSASSLPSSRDQRNSMAQAYLRCIKAQEAADRDIAGLHPMSSKVDSRDSTPKPSPQHLEGRERSISGESISHLVLDGEDDYLYQAANKIGLALQHEANGLYQAAFDQYKAGVSLLLNGVVGDNNKMRREAVRKKTAQYLMKAEDLYNKYLSDMANSKRWESSRNVLEKDPSSIHMRGSPDELENYKVLGVIDKVILVLDMKSFQTYVIKLVSILYHEVRGKVNIIDGMKMTYDLRMIPAIFVSDVMHVNEETELKVLNKSPVSDPRRRTCIPAHCPFVVQLCRYIETDNSVFLVLEYASGGKLWDYASPYLKLHSIVAEEKFKSIERKGVGETGSELVENVVKDQNSLNDQTNAAECQNAEEQAENQIVHAEGKEQILRDDGSVLKSLGGRLPLETESGAEVLSAKNIPNEEADDQINWLSTPLGRNSVEDESTINSNKVQSESKNNCISDSVNAQYGNTINDVGVLNTTSEPFVKGHCRGDSDVFEGFEDSECLNNLAEESLQYYNEPKLQSNELNVVTDLKSDAILNTNDVRPAPLSVFSIDSIDSPTDILSPVSHNQSEFKYSQSNPSADKNFPDIPEDEVFNQTADPNISERTSEIIKEAIDIVREYEDMVKDDLDSNVHKRTNMPAAKDIDTSGFGVESENTDGPENAGVDLSEFFSSKSNQRVSSGELSSPRSQSMGNFEQSQENHINEDHVLLYRSSSTVLKRKDSTTSKSNVWEEFFEQQKLEQEKMDFEVEAQLNRKTEVADLGENFEPAANGKEFLEHNLNGEVNVCVNPFEVQLDKPDSVVRNTWVSVEPEMSTKPSVEVLKEWPSSSSNSMNSTPKHQNKMASTPDSINSSTQNDNPSNKLKTISQNEYQIDSDASKLKNNVIETLSATDSEGGDTLTATSSPSRLRLPSLTTLFSYMDEVKKSKGDAILPEACVRLWAAEILVALAGLHACGIICKDLNPANILLADGGHIRLTYFSQWKCIEPQVDSEATEKFYAAPEVMGLEELSIACDWWSFGVLLYELLTGKPLFSSHPTGISSHSELSIPDHVSQEATSLVKQLLQPVPHARLGAGRSGVEEIKSHPFFSGTDWRTIRG